MPDILHLLTIHASPERVFQALATAEGIRNWWTRDADFFKGTAVESKLPGRVEVAAE